LFLKNKKNTFTYIYNYIQLFYYIYFLYYSIYLSIISSEHHGVLS